MRKNRFMLAAIFLLGIGFAAVTTTLLMTGNVKISTNDADFDVVFTKATSEDGATATITDGGKSITFGTKNLTTVGDIAKLDFEVTNSSELYDAEVSIECSATGEKSSYYSIYKEVATPIEAKTTKAGKVEVTLTKAPVDDIHEDFTCTLTATATERTTKPPTYYAFGDPLTTTDRAIDYTTLTYPYDPEYDPPEFEGRPAKVFVKLEGSQKSVCIVRNGLNCFKNNNWDEEKTHITQVFSDITCTSYDSAVGCDASDFICDVYSYGDVNCNDPATGLRCYLESDGSVYCGEPS